MASMQRSIRIGGSPDGEVAFPLGTANFGNAVTVGSASVLSSLNGDPGGWLQFKIEFLDSGNGPYPVYALSDPITVPAPEPCSFVLAALGLVGFAAWRCWKR